MPGFTEPVSSLSHLLGAGVFTFLGAFLLRRGRGSALRLAFLGVYAFSCVFLLAMSGVYHLLSFEGAPRAVLARLDHGAIFLLIAGTCTPAHGILFRGWGRWGMLLLIWSAAAAGIALKTVFFADVAEWVGLVAYLALGWLGVVSGVALWRRNGFAFIRPLLGGGLAYTSGGVLEFLRWPVLIPGVLGAHELFHVAVLLGAGLHWKFVWQFAGGEGPQAKGEAPTSAPAQ
jgi:channel protein (hemolysin III family)